jgi:ABC-type lipoprotein release transport system permease subunit
LSRLLQQLLFGVTALDALTMVAAPLVLLVVAVVASLIPSWKASKGDPVVALRQN